MTVADASTFVEQGFVVEQPPPEKAVNEEPTDGDALIWTGVPASYM